MNRLWRPNSAPYPDTNNIFDMMMVHQEHLDTVTDSREKITTAMAALCLLNEPLHAEQDANKQITLEAEVAIINNADGEIVIKENVGLRGFMQKIDVISLSDRDAPSISACIDIVSLFSPARPDDAEYLVLLGKAPIQLVRYIDYQPA